MTQNRTRRRIIYGVGLGGIALILTLAVAGRRSLPMLFPERARLHEPAIAVGEPPAPVGENRAAVRFGAPKAAAATAPSALVPPPLVRGDDRFHRTFTPDGLKLSSPFGELQI